LKIVPSSTHITLLHFLSFACTPGVENSIFLGIIAFK
jgi:hypothetical protein